jgi:hypothetical protein
MSAYQIEQKQLHYICVVRADLRSKEVMQSVLDVLDAVSLQLVQIVSDGVVLILMGNHCQCFAEAVFVVQAVDTV